ncbi:hypothetical protein [Enterococcus hirae]|uniref:hypothetical protein n=1 Tax=Enterococcus hirae TaxID=1354 RepID=UPI0015F2856A|nr:hypothetical protein [Enterococcus hirae]MBA5263075.1 hypothetical protein [Enterococcus hirae]
MENNEIKLEKHDDQLSIISNSNFESYLIELGLPSQNILASVYEKQQMAVNIPSVIMQIPESLRKNATYLSKFVSSVAIGRYDSALNDLWNEVVLNLRNKVCLYGLDIFFDAAVGENIRDLYSSEDDLPSIKDRVLLDTCLKLEIISNIVHQKLTYILDMRNHIGGSHPNAGQINSFELLGWLQVCVNEVISDNPSEGAIKVQQFIKNLRTKESLFFSGEIQSIGESLKLLSTTLAGNILRTIFGMYTDPKINNTTKQNILSISSLVWQASPENIKFDLGSNIESYIVNLEQEKQRLGESFFDECNGNSYKVNSRKSLELTLLCEELISKHNGWDNFYHERPVIKKIMSYFKTSSDIPIDRQELLIKTILRCRIGNGVSYNSGVSPGAKGYYNNFLLMLNNNQLEILLSELEDDVILNNLYSEVRTSNLKEILQIISTPLASERVTEVIDYLLDDSKPIVMAQKIKASKFKQLISVF